MTNFRSKGKGKDRVVYPLKTSSKSVSHKVPVIHKESSAKGYATAKGVFPEYFQPNLELLYKPDDYSRFEFFLHSNKNVKKISKNMWVAPPYKDRYQGSHTTTVYWKTPEGVFRYNVPTDKKGIISERVACARLLDVFDGDREGRWRNVFLDVGINAEKRYDTSEKAGTYRWYLYPNESDIKLIDDQNTKILEILKQYKSGRKRCILISGGTPEQRDAISNGIEKNFTIAEKKMIAGNYITIGPTRAGVAGYYSQQTDASARPIGVAEIRINPAYANEKDVSVIVHEAIHLLRDHDETRDPHLRATKKYIGRDADLEESLTEAETVSRERPFNKHKSQCGYYHYLKVSGKTKDDLVYDDRVTINVPKDETDAIKKGKKGKSAQKAVMKNYPKTHIAKLKNKGDAEAIDSYYKLENRKGTKAETETHIQTYAPSGKQSESREDAGMKASAEHVIKYKDGKQVKIK